jgi:hypothetical protein
MGFAIFQGYQGDFEWLDWHEKCVSEFISFLTGSKYTRVFDCPHG